ncbi:MAG: alpha/beta fold hydrolase [Rhodospirillales bacterium]|nr:alpha/beta fold hydrolase [Rhodospirillales bacterium]
MALKLATREYGDGPPLIILHGLFGSAQNWHSMAERLAATYHVVTCDLRNHGASPWSEQMTFPEMADDLETLIEARGLSPASVLGHSVGGKTAMLTALKHSDLVERLIVVDIAPVDYEAPFLAYVRAMQAVDLAAATRRSAIDEQLAEVVPDAATRLFLLQNLIERDGRADWRINLAAIAANMDRLLGFPDVAQFGYDGRALFLSGAESDYIAPRYYGRIFELFPQAEFARIDDAGHYPHVEQPERFLASVVDFLESAYA